MMMFFLISILLLLIIVGVIGAPLWKIHYKKAAIALSFFIIISTGIFYQYWGEGGGLLFWQREGQARYQLHQQFQALGSPNEIVARLQHRIKKEPNDPMGWFLLGRLYYSQQQYQKAAGAFKEACLLDPNNMMNVFQYAQSLFFANENNAAKANVLLHQVIQQQPDFIEAIHLLALIAYQQKHYASAIQYWQTILTILLPHDSKRVLYEEAITQASPFV